MIYYGTHPETEEIICAVDFEDAGSAADEISVAVKAMILETVLKYGKENPMEFLKLLTEIIIKDLERT